YCAVWWPHPHPLYHTEWVEFVKFSWADPHTLSTKLMVVFFNTLLPNQNTHTNPPIVFFFLRLWILFLKKKNTTRKKKKK
ncbi:hypothetical protein, partial [Enterobacter hormaechei]